MSGGVITSSADEAGPHSVNIVHGTHSQLVAFLFLNIWPSHFGIPVLLAIILLSKRIQRHGTFINLCVTFLIVGLSSSLFICRKNYWTRTLSSAVSSSIVTIIRVSTYDRTSVAAFMLVLQMFLVVRASYYGKEILQRDHIVRLWVMLISPYVAFFIAILATSVIGAANPQHVSRNRRFFYCSVDSLPLTNTLTIFAAIFLLATVTLEVWAMFFLYKRYRALRNKIIKPQGELDLSMPVRILAFGFYISIALSLSLLSIKAPHSPAPDLVIASAATFLLLIFGTQRDILSSICFWRDGKLPIEGSVIGASIHKEQMK